MNSPEVKTFDAADLATWFCASDTFVSIPYERRKNWLYVFGKLTTAEGLADLAKNGHLSAVLRRRLTSYDRRTEEGIYILTKLDELEKLEARHKQGL